MSLLSKKIDRYNDTQLVNITGSTNTNIGTKFLDSKHYFPECTSGNDWNISGSFNINVNDVSYTNIILDTRRNSSNSSGTELNGLLCFVTTNGIYFKTGWLATLLTFSYTININSIYSYSINYDSVNKTISLYINSSLVGTQSYTTSFSTSPKYSLIAGRTGFENFSINNININYLATFNKQLSENEINYLYSTGVIHESTHENCMLHLPLKDVPVISSDNRIRKNTDTNSLDDNWVQFNISPQVGDEFTCFNSSGNSFRVGIGNVLRNRLVFGLTDSSSPVLSSSNSYLFTTINNNNVVVAENNITRNASTEEYGQIYKLTILTSTTIGAYIDGSLVYTFTGINLTNLKLFCKVENGINSPISDIQKNGVSIQQSSFYNQIINLRMSDYVFKNVVANYNYAKTSPIIQSDIYDIGVSSAYSQNEIGISNPSRLSSFKDFHTKNQYYGVGIRYDSSSPDKMSGLTPTITPVDFTNGYTVVVKMFLDTLDSVRSDILYQSGQPNNGIYVRYNSIGSFEVSNGASWNLQTENYRFKLVTVVAVVSLTTTALYVNGRTANYPSGIYNPNPVNTTYPTSITGACLLGSIFSSRQCKGVYFTGLFNKTLTPQEVSEKSKNEDWLSLNPTFFYSSENDGTEYIDQSGNLGNATINDPTYFQSNQKYSNLGGVPYNNYQKGLNFDSSKQQYLEVTGLEAFDKDDGYTFIIKVKIDNSFTSRNPIFNALDLDSTNDRYVIARQLNKTNQMIFVSPVGTSGNTDTLIYDSVDVTKETVLVCSAGVLDRNTAYNTVKKYIDINSTSNYLINNSTSNIDLSLGFDDFVNPKFYIGYNTANFLNGKLSSFSIIKGFLDRDDVLSIQNNNIYRSPYEVLQDTSKIILDVDFQNPFVDGTDIKFPDNSGNCEVIAKQNSGTDWSTLTGVENSVD